MENQKNIFLEFLKLLRIFSFCLFLWFFGWAHFYKYPMDVMQFQNVLAYMIFLFLAFYAQFRLSRIGKVSSEKAKKKRGRPRKIDTEKIKDKPACFGELKIGLPLKDECKTCKFLKECTG